jgi:hypothetical protein
LVEPTAKNEEEWKKLHTKEVAAPPASNNGMRQEVLIYTLHETIIKSLEWQQPYCTCSESGKSLAV